MQPKVYILILNWNGWQDSIECLESVLKLDYRNYQIVLCDNDSSDGSLDKLISWANGERQHTAAPSDRMAVFSSPESGKPLTTDVLSRETVNRGYIAAGQAQLTLIQNGANLGFAGGNNVGLRHIQNQGDADFIWLLNNDTVTEPDALSAMVNHSVALTEGGQPNTCGSLVCFYDDPDVVQGLGGSKFNYNTGIASESLGRYSTRNSEIDHKAISQQIDFITGCSWLIPRAFLDEIGLMEESYFLYYEEVDWIVRSRQKYAVTYAPQSIVYHKEGSSIGSKSMARGPSVLSDYYKTSSRIQFMRLHFPRRLAFVYLTALLQAANRLRQGLPKNAWIILKVLVKSLIRRKDSHIPAA